MTDAMVVFTMFSVAMGAAIVGINNEPAIAAGRIPDLHRKFKIDLRSPSAIASGKAAELATKMAAAMAIVSILVLFVKHLSA
ncbi:hypothetical protein ABIC16_003859 [Sphingomonas sp. PvP055]